MKARGGRAVVAVLTSAIIIATAAGCDSHRVDNTSARPLSGSRIDTSQYVQLNVTSLSVPGSDFDNVVNKINEKLKKDLNCTVKFTTMTFAEASQKYPVAIASGEKIDLIWGSSVWNSIAYAAKGAFMDIGNMLKTYTPALYDFYPGALWDSTRINGKIYAVPSCGPITRYSTYGFLYREDLRRKFNLPEVKDVPSIEAYLAGIRRYTGLTPVVDNGGQLSMFHMFADLNNIYDAFGTEPGSYGIGVRYSDKTKLFNVWATPQFEQTAELMKRWADAGFWSKDVLFSNEDITSALLSGKSVASFNMNPDMAFTEVIYPTSVSHPEWKWKYLNFAQISGKALLQHPLSAFFSVPKSSRHPVRALAVLDKFTLDRDYYRLVSYGIEGKDYRSDSHGNYVRIGNGFGKNGLGTFPENPALGLKNPGETMANEFKSTLRQFAVKDFATQFVEDNSAYTVERAKMTQVYNRFCRPLMAGIAPGDVKTNVENLLEEAKAAGQNRILKTMQAQWTKYCEATDIK